MDDLQRRYAEAANRVNKTIREINNQNNYGAATVRQKKAQSKKKGRR